MLGAYPLKQFKKIAEALAYDIGVTAHSHEVRVTTPAGNNMRMHMLGQPGSAANVDPYRDVRHGAQFERAGVLRHHKEGRPLVPARRIRPTSFPTQRCRA